MAYHHNLPGLLPNNIYGDEITFTLLVSSNVSSHLKHSYEMPYTLVCTEFDVSWSRSMGFYTYLISQIELQSSKG
jgi:hypothetical protein